MSACAWEPSLRIPSPGCIEVDAAELEPVLPRLLLGSPLSPADRRYIAGSGAAATTSVLMGLVRFSGCTADAGDGLAAAKTRSNTSGRSNTGCFGYGCQRLPTKRRRRILADMCPTTGRKWRDRYRLSAGAAGALIRATLSAIQGVGFRAGTRPQQRLQPD